MRASERILVFLMDKPSQIAKLLDCLEGVADLLADKRLDLDTAQLTDSLRGIPGFGPLGGLVQYVLKDMAAQRSV